jgi:hypothetical protein
MRPDPFGGTLRRAEQKAMASLTSPPKIQDFLDQTSYSTEDIYRCPLRVLREQRAHCFDGRFRSQRHCGDSVSSLVRNSSPMKEMTTTSSPLQARRFWGAVAKSNFVGRRF